MPTMLLDILESDRVIGVDKIKMKIKTGFILMEIIV